MEGQGFLEKKPHVALQLTCWWQGGESPNVKNGRYSDTIDTSSKNGRFFGFERSWHFLTRKVSWVPPSPFLFLFEMLLLFASLHFALPPRQDAGLSPFRSRKMNTPSFSGTPKTHPRQMRVCSGFEIHKHIYIYYHLHIPGIKKSQQGRLIKTSTSSPRNPRQKESRTLTKKNNPNACVAKIMHQPKITDNDWF